MSKYPVIEVGDPVTADMLTGMQPDIAYKQTATSRASTTTLADDPDLITPTLAAGGTYLVEFWIRYTGLIAGGIKTAWTVPAAVLSSNRDVLGAASTASQTDADIISMRTGVHGYATSVSYGMRTSAGNQLRATETGVVILGATPGVVTLQWAQTASSATATVVSAGSLVRTTRIG